MHDPLAHDHHDTLARFIFLEAGIRGVRCTLSQSVREAIGRYPYPANIADLMAQAFAAITLIHATLKMRGRISLHLQGAEHLPLLMVEINHRHQMRGIAHWHGKVENLSFPELVAGGVLAFHILPDDGERYQGIVPLDGASLADCLEHYFMQSEQLPTRFWFATNPSGVGGLMLQQLPDISDEQQSLWEEATMLAGTVQPEELIELPHDILVHRLFAEHDVELLGETQVVFYCPCTRERALSSILTLPNTEIRDILKEQGQIRADCEFCRAEYLFGEDEIFDLIMKRGDNDERMQ
jgi:molecular chaperone Hsp33